MSKFNTLITHEYELVQWNWERKKGRERDGMARDNICEIKMKIPIVRLFLHADRDL